MWLPLRSKLLPDKDIDPVVVLSVFELLILLSHLYIVLVLRKKLLPEAAAAGGAFFIVALEWTLLPLLDAFFFFEKVFVETDFESLHLASKPSPPPFSLRTGKQRTDG